MRCKVKRNSKSLQQKANRMGGIAFFSLIGAALCAECIPLCVLLTAVAVIAAAIENEIERGLN